jgi:hypothetical protein
LEAVNSRDRGGGIAILTIRESSTPSRFLT